MGVAIPAVINMCPHFCCLLAGRSRHPQHRACYSTTPHITPLLTSYTPFLSTKSIYNNSNPPNPGIYIHVQLESLYTSSSSPAMSSPLPKKILVFGATGVIGKYIIREIVNAQSSFDRIGLFTSPQTAETKSSELDGWRDAGVEVIVGDVTSEADIKKAYEGA
jgi:hypothetical protein